MAFSEAGASISSFVRPCSSFRCPRCRGGSLRGCTGCARRCWPSGRLRRLGLTVPESLAVVTPYVFGRVGDDGGRDGGQRLRAQRSRRRPGERQAKVVAAVRIRLPLPRERSVGAPRADLAFTFASPLSGPRPMAPCRCASGPPTNNPRRPGRPASKDLRSRPRGAIGSLRREEARVRRFFENLARCRSAVRRVWRGANRFPGSYKNQI